MPPSRGGDGCTEQQQHQPATVHRARDEAALSRAPQKQKQYQRRAASLHDDVLIDILSRVRYKSLCRFKCVSKVWLALCSELDIHNNRSPQRTVSGYFGRNSREAFGFHDLTARDVHPPLVDPTLSFLGRYERIDVEQCCGGGLLLCKCWESRSDEDKYSYVVCNPATEKWTMLPPIEFPGITADGCHIVEGRLFDLNKAEHKLCFDALNPSRFVVAVGMDNSFGQVREVAIYSSETGRWTSMQSMWSSGTILEDCGDEAILLNGTMHFYSIRPSIVTVDIEGKVWREIEVPNIDSLVTIGQSQGYLHYWCVDNDYQLYIWVLKDYASANWTLKHTVNILKLFGKNYPTDHKRFDVAIHPDRDLIFLTGWEMTISYDMNSRKVHVIYSSKAFVFGALYIPCFAKWPSRKVAVPDSYK